jgi:hypothetical protein
MASEPGPAKRDGKEPADDGPVPLFGSWAIAYTAVIVCAVLVMALVALFSGWPY